MWDNILQGQN